MIRLCHVITNVESGGAQHALADLIGATRDEFAHRVVSLRGFGPGDHRLLGAGAVVESLNMRPGWPDPLALPRLVARLRRVQPRLVVTWLYHADLMGGMAARLAGIPVCWNVRHGAIDREATRPATRAVVRLCGGLSARVPAAIVFNAERSLAAHRRLGYRAARMLVIPNGIDTARFQPDETARSAVRRELGLRDETPLVGLAGRYCDDKDFETFMRCAGRVAEHDPDVRFLLCGRGVDSHNAELADGVRRHCLSARAHLLGQRDDMPRVLAALDVLVCSSRTEAFPNVVAEAMACGVPSVSTDVGDVRHLLGSTGQAVPIGDWAGLARECQNLLAAPEKMRVNESIAARQRIESHFSVKLAAQRHAAAWRELAESRSTASQAA